MILPIVTIDNDVENILTKPSEKVPLTMISLMRPFLFDMDQTRFRNNGVGLAAPQVGRNVQVCIVSFDNGLDIFFNPVIEKKSDTIIELEEQCLSIPGKSFVVPRPEWIEVSFFNQDRKYITNKRFNGIHARIVSHEIDHLQGVLINQYGPTI